MPTMPRRLLSDGAIPHWYHPVLQDGLTRRDLDVALLVAEAEPIIGLPDWPQAFPDSVVDEGLTGLTGFKLRRAECMSGSHAAAVARLASRLALLKVVGCYCFWGKREGSGLCVSLSLGLCRGVQEG